jgi:hypothetical protein
LHSRGCGAVFAAIWNALADWNRLVQVMGPGKTFWLGISARLRVVLMAMLAVTAVKLTGHLTSSGDGAVHGPGIGARIALDRAAVQPTADMTAGMP